MQPQMNPASLPTPGAPPSVAPRRPRSHGGLILLVLLLAAGAGYYAWQKWNPAKANGGKGAVVAVRTAPVVSGKLQRTLRLTGATTAEKYSTLSAPRLRGGRGGGASQMISTAVSTPTSTVSTASTVSSSSSSSTSSSSTTSSSTSSLRGASNRFTSSSTSKTSGTASSSAAIKTSTVISSQGDGSGERMSGGTMDFMQVLQSVAKPGSRVEPGAVVGEFDTQYQQNRVDDYQAVVDQAERTLRSLDTNIEVSKKAIDLNLDKAKAAVEKAKLDIKTIPVRSEIDAEKYRLALEEAEAQLQMLQSQRPQQDVSLKAQRRNSEITVEQSRIELQRAQKNVEQMRIKAGIGGMLVMENMLRGSEFSQIQQGDQLYPGQLFGRVVDPNSMLVSATVNQADAESVRVGYRAELRFDAYPDLVLPAHVISMAALTKSGGMRANYLKEIQLYLKIDKMDVRVIPDLTVSADVILSTDENQVLVPREAVFTGQKPFVYVKTAAGYDKREIEIANSNHILVAVAGGVKVGEVVALEQPTTQQPQAQQQAAVTRGTEAWRKRESLLGVFNV